MWQLLVVIAVATCFQQGESFDGYGPRAAANEVNGAFSSSNEVNGANGRYVCPGGFVRMGNSCYYFSATMATWQDAHFECKDRGAQLARMEKKWEDKNMRAHLNRQELAAVERWIGGIYNWEAKRWEWGHTARRLGYQGFSRRKPFANNKWHCIVMDPGMMYRWAARSCVVRKHYICEKRLKSERLRAVPTGEIVHAIPSNNVPPLPTLQTPGKQRMKQRNEKWRGVNRRSKEERQRARELARQRSEELFRRRAAQDKSIGVH